MGTVNYKTSDYITLGVKPYNAIAEMRQEVRNTPTWERYNSDCCA